MFAVSCAVYIEKMRTTSLLALTIYLHYHVSRSYAASARTTDAILLGEVDIAVEDNDIGISTEKPFIKKCIVDGYGYSHSQSIPSNDPNSHCLCVVGEVYCWWQSYTPSTDPPFSSFEPTEENNTAADENTEIDVNLEATDESAEAYVEDQNGYDEANSTSNSSPIVPAICTVMGREYHEGETLPHSTGNCVECSCGTEGRVECSPRDCVALRPEAPVAPELPDGTDFEVFDLNRDRGIDDTF